MYKNQLLPNLFNHTNASILFKYQTIAKYIDVTRSILASV